MACSEEERAESGGTRCRSSRRCHSMVLPASLPHRRATHSPSPLSDVPRCVGEQRELARSVPARLTISVCTGTVELLYRSLASHAQPHPVLDSRRRGAQRHDDRRWVFLALLLLLLLTQSLVDRLENGVELG